MGYGIKKTYLLDYIRIVLADYGKLDVREGLQEPTPDDDGSDVKLGVHVDVLPNLFVEFF